jgi:hypothetical protein
MERYAFQRASRRSLCACLVTQVCLFQGTLRVDKRKGIDRWIHILNTG